jgi:hypothetical protein
LFNLRLGVSYNFLQRGDVGFQCLDPMAFWRAISREMKRHCGSASVIEVSTVVVFNDLWKRQDRHSRRPQGSPAFRTATVHI